MQVVRLLSGLVFVLLLASSAARAEDSAVVEIGHTGLYLPNNALGQDRHYLKQDDDLLGRIACLMQDVDLLLAELHALPSGWEGTQVAAEPTAAELVTLIDLALKHNPTLQPYASQLAVKAARTRQAGAKPDPMVKLNLANFPVPQFDPEDTPMTQIIVGWSQKYEGYGKRGLKRSIAQLEEDLTELDRAKAELQLIGDLTDLYYSMVSTSARLEVIEENIALLDLLIEYANGKYALGLTPQAHVLQAEVERSRLEEKKIELGSLLARQQEMLIGLIGHASGFDPATVALETAYPLPAPVAWNDTELLQSALARRPDYQRLSIVEDQQGLKVELAHREYRPDYTMSASYGTRWGKRDFFTVGVSVPLFTHKAERQDAKLQEAYASLDVTISNRATLENMLATRLGTLRVEVNRIAELSSLYREGLLPQARLALDSAIAGYAANRVDLADLLKSQTMLLNHELELEQLYIEYLAALSETYIITAGAFSPGEWLADSIVFDDGVTVSTQLDIEDRIAAGQALEPQPEAMQPEAPGPPALAPQPGPGFVEGLSLPQATTPAELETALSTAAQVGESLGAAAAQAGDSAAPEEAEEGEGKADVVGAGFYAPFKPRTEETNDD